jgi:hypothetical protein
MPYIVRESPSTLVSADIKRHTCGALHSMRPLAASMTGSTVGVGTGVGISAALATARARSGGGARI